MSANTTTRFHIGAGSRRGGFGIARGIWLLAVAIAAILLLGIALTWADANPGNDIVHGIMSAGRWLATPFHDVFTNTNARARLTENWLLAAGIYLIGGRILAWIVSR